MSHKRPERIADTIQRVLADLVRDQVRDPSVGFVTITEVRVSRDLKYARVYVSAIQDREPCVRGLNRAAGFLRRGLASRAGLRFAPELRFVIDDSAIDGFRIERILDDVAPSAAVAEGTAETGKAANDGDGDDDGGDHDPGETGAEAGSR